MGSSGLFAVFGGVHRHLGLDHEVFELHCLDEVCVPDLTAILDANMWQLERVFMETLATDLEVVLTAENSRVLLHSLLHLNADFSSWLLAGREAKLVKLGN